MCARSKESSNRKESILRCCEMILRKSKETGKRDFYFFLLQPAGHSAHTKTSCSTGECTHRAESCIRSVAKTAPCTCSTTRRISCYRGSNQFASAHSRALRDTRTPSQLSSCMSSARMHSRLDRTFLAAEIYPELAKLKSSAAKNSASAVSVEEPDLSWTVSHPHAAKTPDEVHSM